VTLDTAESDFPWLVGWLEPAPEFAAVEPLFAEMDGKLDEDGLTDESIELHEQVMEPGIQMRSLQDGELSNIVGISIGDRRVSWRI